MKTQTKNPEIIMRDGKPVAVILDIDIYDPHSVLINKSQLIKIDYAICRKFCQTKRYLWESWQKQ